MKTHLLIALLLVAALFVALPAPQAQAQYNGWGGGGGCGWGGYDLGYLYGNLAYNVPYFAAFPPVYYSYPVPRTYGYSPFAYPPGTMTPDVAMDANCEPLEIINPYVPSTQQDKAAPKSDQTASVSRDPQPLVILNPYVTQRAVAQSHD